MTAPTFDGSFAHNWTAEILPNRPMILPARHYVYPALVDEVELGALEVLIQSGNPPPPEEGFSPQTQPFLATCALGFRDPATPTGIWAMPNPDWPLVGMSIWSIRRRRSGLFICATGRCCRSVFFRRRVRIKG